jgi:hypothetical protein
VTQEAREYWDGLKGQRQHVNSGGKPKVAYRSVEEAKAGIELLMREKDPGARLSAYQCKICKFLHIGNDKHSGLPDWDKTLVKELGVRVVAQMWQENYSGSRRLKFIKQRFQAIEKRIARGDYS